MRFDAHFGEAEAVQLKAAILLYGGAKRIAFASVHEPYRDPAGGAPYLDAGRPITTEFLRALARGLGLGMAPEILPESVLMRTPEVTAWWVPAAVRPMFFSANVGWQDSQRTVLSASAAGLRPRRGARVERPRPARESPARAAERDRHCTILERQREPGQSASVQWPHRAQPVLPAWRSGWRASFKANSRMLEASRSPATARATSASGVIWQGGRPFRRNG